MLPWSGRDGSRFLLRFDTTKTMLDSQTCVVWGKGEKPPGVRTLAALLNAWSSRSTAAICTDGDHPVRAVIERGSIRGSA